MYHFLSQYYTHCGTGVLRFLVRCRGSRSRLQSRARLWVRILQGTILLCRPRVFVSEPRMSMQTFLSIFVRHVVAGFIL